MPPDAVDRVAKVGVLRGAVMLLHSSCSWCQPSDVDAARCVDPVAAVGWYSDVAAQQLLQVLASMPRDSSIASENLGCRVVQ
jgi:hypothetical protein